MISALNLPTLEKKYFERLNDAKITGIGYELIGDQVGGKPIIRAMGEIAGSTVLLIAAEYLSNANGGRGIILGGITGVPPSKIVILGVLRTINDFSGSSGLGCSWLIPGITYLHSAYVQACEKENYAGEQNKARR